MNVHKSNDETARRQEEATHCRELERAKQLCADSSTASGGGYRLAPPRIVQGFKIEAVKHKLSTSWFLYGGTQRAAAEGTDERAKTARSC